MGTQSEYQERIAKKIAAAKWPDDVPRPTKTPKLKLVGTDGNAFSVLGKARRAAKEAQWTDAQFSAFYKLATSGDYDNVLCTCMDYFDVR